MRSRPWMQTTRSTASGIRFWSWWCSIVRAWCCRFSLDLFCEEMHTATGEVSPSGKWSELSCNGHLTGKRTKLSWDNGHPPECSKYKTEENCRYVEKCVCVCFLIHMLKRQARSRKSTRNLKNTTIAIVSSNQKSGCASQNVELPEQTVGLTNENRSILKETGKRSPRAHLKLKYTKTADRFFKLREQLGPSRAVNIIEIPTRLRLRTKIQTTRCCQKMMQEKQLGKVPRSCTKFAERTWRTNLLSSSRS